MPTLNPTSKRLLTLTCCVALASLQACLSLDSVPQRVDDDAGMGKVDGSTRSTTDASRNGDSGMDKVESIDGSTRFTRDAFASRDAQDGADDTDAGSTPGICAATCSSSFASPHNFQDPADLSAIVGRWLVCAQGSLAPTDQAGVELTSDGHFIILRRGGSGNIVRGTGDDAQPTYTSGGANGTGSFELRMGFAPYSTLEGDFSDCPKRLRLRELTQGSGPYPIAEYIFDSGIEPEGCTFPSNGCDYCGSLTCAPGTLLDSTCRCLQGNGVVRPQSQTCDFCCGKQCAAGEFLDYQCQCYASPSP